MLVRVAPLAVVAAALGGCWSLTDVGDLTSGAASARSRDPDASGDGGRGDGDAGDAGGDAAVGCARFPDAFFCDDFERDGALGDAFWTHHDPPATGAIELFTSDFVSPTHAARISLSSGSCAFVELAKTVPGTISRLTLRADVRVGRGALGALSMWIAKGDGSGYPIILDMRDGGDLAVMVQHVSGSNVTDFPEGASRFVASPFGAWTDAELTLESTPNRVARARVGATVVETALPGEISLTDVEADVGIYCSEGSRSVLVDDVAIIVAR